MINISELRKSFSMGSLLTDNQSITAIFRPSGNVIEQRVYGEDCVELLNLLRESTRFCGTIDRGRSISFIAYTENDHAITSIYPPAFNRNDVDSRDVVAGGYGEVASVSSFLENVSTRGKSAQQLAYEFIKYIERPERMPEISAIEKYNDLFLETQALANSVDCVFQHDDPDESFDGCTIITFESSEIKRKRKDEIDIEIFASALLLSSELGIEMSVEDGWYSMIFYA